MKYLIWNGNKMTGNGIKQLAKECCFRILAATEEKNVDKTAYSFYGIVKEVYASAKSEGIFDKEKDEIIDLLKVTQAMVKLILETEGWTIDMINEFDNKIEKLWNLDGDEEC